MLTKPTRNTLCIFISKITKKGCFNFTYLLSLFLSLFLANVTNANPILSNNTPSISIQNSTYNDNQALVIDDIELLKINHKIKTLLDKEIRPIKSKQRQVFALHLLLFTVDNENIRYDFTSTKTAQETFDSKSGNCLSHAALFVAAARYLGLDAVFQTVYIPRRWEKKDDFLIVPEHLNVLVKLPSSTQATIEFAGTRLENDALKSKKTKDDAVLSEYYNNKGAEALTNKQYDLAIAYFQKSISTYKRSKSAWSNLGVTYKLLKDYEKAEHAYLQSFKIDSRNISIIQNLYSLYTSTKQDKKAEKYFEKAKKYSKKNPYGLFKLAQIDYLNGNFKRAQKSLQKAIKLKHDDPDFHHVLAKVYYQQNKKEKAINSIKRARDVALSPGQQEKFQNKIARLQ